MKLLVLTTCDKPEHEGYQRLKASLDKFGYDYHCIIHPFTFGHQLPIIRDYCKTSDATHILYTDAYDTIAFSDPKEVKLKFISFGSRMLISTEKACYPHPDRAKDYPESMGQWKYVNGGGWMAQREYFLELCEKENLNESSHDQVWLMEALLKNQAEIKLDTNCQIFQTIAFSYWSEWEPHAERFLNKETNSHPVFFHGNGHTEMNWLTL
jgi:hypothetical protein